MLIALPETPTLPTPFPEGIIHAKNSGYFSWSKYTSTWPSFIQSAYTSYCAVSKIPSLSLLANRETPLQSTKNLHSTFPFDVLMILLIFSWKLVFTEISAPLSLACLAACLSNSLLLITMIFCFCELIVISFPSGEKIFAHSILLSNVFGDASIPNSFKAF